MSLDPEICEYFEADVLANVVPNETDIRQVVTKVELGEADAGIVYVSDAVAAPELNLSSPSQKSLTSLPNIQSPSWQIPQSRPSGDIYRLSLISSRTSDP